MIGKEVGSSDNYLYVVLSSKKKRKLSRNDKMSKTKSKNKRDSVKSLMKSQIEDVDQLKKENRILRDENRVFQEYYKVFEKKYTEKAHENLKLKE